MRCCRAEYGAKYYAERGDKLRAANRARHHERMSDPEARAAERDRLAAWRAAHPDAWKAIRARAQEKARASGTNAKRDAARRARTRGKRVSVVSLRAILERYGMHCSICDTAIEHDAQLTYDHVVPLARGGAHDDGNLRPAHRSCNGWKGDRLPDEIAGSVPPPPEEVDTYVCELRRQRRSEQMKARMAAMTPEQRAERGRKIGAAKKGRKYPPGHRMGGARPQTAESQAKRVRAVRAFWDAKTPEERDAWRKKISDAKRAAKAPNT